MQVLVLIIHVLAALGVIVLVLLQHGKGADVGATFGAGSSQTMFGSAGSMSFFMKLTSVLAAIFFVTSLTLSYLASHAERKPGVFEVPQPSSQPQTQQAPLSQPKGNVAPPQIPQKTSP